LGPSQLARAFHDSKTLEAAGRMEIGRYDAG
jgi:hypothetical protein